MPKVVNLIIGIILAGIVLLNVGGTLLSHCAIDMSFLLLNGSLFLFAISRFIMFAMPEASAPRVIRMVALLGFLAYIFTKSKG